MRLLPALALALTLPAAALGAPKTAPAAPKSEKKSAKRKKEAPALPAPKPEPGSAMVQYAPSSGPITVPLVLERFEDFDRRMTSLTAKFRQTVRLEESGGIQNVEGEVEFLKPSRLRLERLRPERQTIVSDGNLLWAYNRDNNQVIKTSFSQWKQSEPLAQGLLDFGNYGGLIKRYDVAVSTVGAPDRDGHRVFELRLKPRDKTAEFLLDLILSTRDYFPYEARMKVGQISISSRFDAVRLNAGLEEARFRFLPPAGADVFENFPAAKAAP